MSNQVNELVDLIEKLIDIKIEIASEIAYENRRHASKIRSEKLDPLSKELLEKLEEILEKR